MLGRFKRHGTARISSFPVRRLLILLDTRISALFESVGK